MIKRQIHYTISMAMFNSHVKWPDGIHDYQSDEAWRLITLNPALKNVLILRITFTIPNWRPLEEFGRRRATPVIAQRSITTLVSTICQCTNAQAYNYIISKYEITWTHTHTHRHTRTDSKYNIYTKKTRVPMSGHTFCHENGRKVRSQATAVHGCSKLRGNSHVLVGTGTGAMGICHCTRFQFHIMLLHQSVQVIPAFTKGVLPWKKAHANIFPLVI